MAPHCANTPQRSVDHTLHNTSTPKHEIVQKLFFHKRDAGAVWILAEQSNASLHSTQRIEDCEATALFRWRFQLKIKFPFS